MGAKTAEKLSTSVRKRHIRRAGEAIGTSWDTPELAERTKDNRVTKDLLGSDPFSAKDQL